MVTEITPRPPNPPKADPKVMKSWVEALRSGDHTQGYRTLNRIRPLGDPEDEYSNVIGLCCLGVLCEVAVKAGVIPAGVNAHGSMRYGAAGQGSFLPEEVMEWAGLADVNPWVEVIRVRPGTDDEMYAATARLADLNDEERASFEEIADIIEDQFIAKPVASLTA